MPNNVCNVMVSNAERTIRSDHPREQYPQVDSCGLRIRYVTLCTLYMEIHSLSLDGVDYENEMFVSNRGSRLSEHYAFDPELHIVDSYYNVSIKISVVYLMIRTAKTLKSVNIKFKVLAE